MNFLKVALLASSSHDLALRAPSWFQGVFTLMLTDSDGGIPDTKGGQRITFLRGFVARFTVMGRTRLLLEQSSHTRSTVATMKMATHHHGNHDHYVHHPLRTLLFAIVVIIVAMLVAATTTVQTERGPMAQSESSVFMTVAQHAINGEEVFNRVCSTCHAIERPTDPDTEPLAPPMKMVIRHYLMATDSPDEAQGRIVDWLKGPDAEKSLMPPMAIEHHGLMPPVVLTEDERVAVAQFVMTLAKAPGQGMMNGQMQHQGQMKHEGHEQGEGQQGEGMMMRQGQNGMKAGKMQQRMQMKGEGQMKGCKHMNGEGEGQMKGCKHMNGEGEGQMKGCKHMKSEGGA